MGINIGEQQIEMDKTSSTPKTSSYREIYPSPYEETHEPNSTPKDCSREEICSNSYKETNSPSFYRCETP